MPSSISRVIAGLAALAVVACARSDRSDSSAAEQIAHLESELTKLEADVVRAEDISAIKRLQRAYGYYFDAAAWDQIADLFSDDGSLEIGLDGVYVGKKRIRQYLEALGGGHVRLSDGRLNEQMQLQPVISLGRDGLSAKGRWHSVVMIGQFRQSAFWGDGTSENEYAKVDGVWKIKKIHWYQTFLVPYAGGWIKNKDANGGIYASGSLPPDKPPSEHYQTWPGVFIPPFHYRNPVTGR